MIMNNNKNDHPQSVYQNHCELIKFNHPFVTGGEALLKVPRLPECYRNIIHLSSIDRTHPYTDICTATNTSLDRSIAAFDTLRRTCMACYDAILLTKHHYRSTIIMLEGELNKVNEENSIGTTLLRAMTMWENMIHIMNMVEPTIIIGDLLQLQCCHDNTVHFYGLWIVHPGKRIRGDIADICTSCGMYKVKYYVLQYEGAITSNSTNSSTNNSSSSSSSSSSSNCSSRSSSSSSSNNSSSMVLHHIQGLFQSLLRKYTNSRRFDRTRTIHELSLADIAVTDHDRCFVRCCIPLTC